MIGLFPLTSLVAYWRKKGLWDCWKVDRESGVKGAAVKWEGSALRKRGMQRRRHIEGSPVVCFSESGPWSSKASPTWEFVRNADFQTPPGSHVMHRCNEAWEGLQVDSLVFADHVAVRVKGRMSNQELVHRIKHTSWMLLLQKWDKVIFLTNMNFPLEMTELEL